MQKIASGLNKHGGAGSRSRKSVGKLIDVFYARNCLTRCISLGEWLYVYIVLVIMLLFTAQSDIYSFYAGVWINSIIIVVIIKLPHPILRLVLTLGLDLSLTSALNSNFLVANFCDSDIIRDQLNSREKMHDFVAEFLKCVKFHGKFTERVSEIHGPHRRYFEVLC